MTGARKFGVITFGAILIALFAGIAIAQGGIGKPSVKSGDIAHVEDVPDGLGDISQKDFNRSFIQTWKRAGLNAAPKEDDAQYGQVREAAINDLLDRAWLTGEANELGIEASTREVAAELATIRNDQFEDKAAFDKFLKDSGFTLAEVRDRVRLQVLSTKIQEKITNAVSSVDDSEIENFYEASKASFTTPASRDIQLIVTDSKKRADAAKKALGNSPDEKKFKQVARKFSTHASKEQGGETVATEGAFPDPAGADIMSAAADELQGPVEANDQFYIFRVTKVNEEKVQPLDEVREQITQQLLPTLQQKAMSDFVADYNAKWTSRTVCAEDYTVSRCSNYEGSGRPASADPACFEPGAGSKKDLVCPAPVALVAPLAPGSNATAAGLGQQQQALPQGPIPSGDSTKAPDPAAGGAEGLDLGGAAGGDAAAQAAAAQA
ncbi:MAG: peptidyl-prolyl cis-trans isomerase, partial [Actinomycetota bacterium]|nr:peptidyl-prolyl cis-trans isomerase [Actinomycetota bacterium]